LPGVIEAIKAINEKGYLVIVVTNQKGDCQRFDDRKQFRRDSSKDASGTSKAWRT